MSILVRFLRTTLQSNFHQGYGRKKKKSFYMVYLGVHIHNDKHSQYTYITTVHIDRQWDSIPTIQFVSGTSHYERTHKENVKKGSFKKNTFSVWQVITKAIETESKNSSQLDKLFQEKGNKLAQFILVPSWLRLRTIPRKLNTWIQNFTTNGRIHKHWSYKLWGLHHSFWIQQNPQIETV